MARIVSNTPGRLRLRVRPERRHHAFMHRVHEHLEGRDGVASVQTIAQTGSVTVEYDPHRHTAADLLGVFRDLGVIAEDVTKEPSPDELLDGGPSTTASGIVARLDDLDNRLSRLTGRRVDLKLLFPATLGGLGILQIARNGLELGDVPGYILLWYAFDSFFKLHVRTAEAKEHAAEQDALAHERSGVPARG